MNESTEIPDEVFLAKEQEIAQLFGNGSGSPPAAPVSSESETRIARIMQRARQDPSSDGVARIARIMQRLTEAGAYDENR